MITTDTGAKKLEGTDNWRQIIQAHNDSVDAHDAGIEGLQDALGIVVDGDQAAVSASTGQYIILKNSTITGCTDGLYTATKAIPANTAIDNTYLSAVSGGGLNALNTQIITKKLNVSFTDGYASVAISDVSSSATVVISRRAHAPSSLIIAANVTNTNTISMSAWEASAKANYTGTVNVCLLIDSR